MITPLPPHRPRLLAGFLTALGILAGGLLSAQALEPKDSEATKEDLRLTTWDRMGLVTTTNAKWEFAIVNMGSAHGVTKDTEFIISRDGRIVTRLRVEEVKRLQSVTSFDPKAKVPVKRGDRATFVAADDKAPRKIRGPVDPKIRAIYPSLGFIVLTGGSIEGIAKKDAVEVMRDGKVIANLIITTVEGENSAADIVPGSLKKGVELRAGDTVRKQGKVPWKPKVKEDENDPPKEEAKP